MPAPMLSHDQKSHVAPNFNHLDLRNVMVSLTTLLASHDSKTSASGVNDQKSYFEPHFKCDLSKEYSGAITDTIGIMLW